MTTRYELLLDNIDKEQDYQTELAQGMDSDDVRMYRFYASESRAADLSNLAVAEQERIANLIAFASIPTQDMSIESARMVSTLATPARRAWAVEQAMIALGIPADVR